MPCHALKCSDLTWHDMTLHDKYRKWLLKSREKGIEQCIDSNQTLLFLFPSASQSTCTQDAIWVNLLLSRCMTFLHHCTVAGTLTSTWVWRQCYKIDIESSSNIWLSNILMSEPFSIVIQCNTDVNRKNFYKAFQHLRPTSFSLRAETAPRREVSQSVSQSEGGECLQGLPCFYAILFSVVYLHCIGIMDWALHCTVLHCTVFQI